MKVNNISSEYAQEIKEFDRIPKTVLASVLVSVLSNGGSLLYEVPEEEKIDIDNEILKEWNVLYNAGIVKQKPFKKIDVNELN
ncbi:MAG: hypothetical protein KDK54_19770 [Leptospiraceae bacterium]|nr:hypothetical protein [Leptospiraceae bacterium]